MGDFSALRQHILTWIDIECRLSEHNRVVCVQMDRISGSLAFSTPLNSSTINGVKTCPKREFQKLLLNSV